MFEKEIRSLLISRNEPFVDRTSSHTALDFFLPNYATHIDAKEKRQRFSIRNWPEAPMPQEFLFILDDLAVRKLLYHAPNSFSLIRDSSSTPPKYYVYSVVDLLCVPKKRCKRPIRRTVSAYKGKWLVDLRDAASFATLGDAINYILRYRKKHPAIFESHLDCWGGYHSERINTGGRTRTAGYWKEDAKAHL